MNPFHGLHFQGEIILENNPVVLNIDKQLGD